MMMSLLSALHCSAAAALACAAPCSPCPPESECAETVDVRVESEIVPLVASAVARLRSAPQVEVSLPRIATLLASSGQDSTSVVKIVIRNDNGELQYSDENGTITATHNGAAIPPDRIQREGGTVRILGDDGGTLYEFRVASPGATRVIRRGDGAQWRAVGENGDVFVGAAAPRTGRIGVYLAPADESVRAENGIDSETAVTITGTVEGSPAQEAGLQSEDIIVRVNGQTASEETLRQIIGATEPGHEVTLRIVRAGEPRDVKVRVEPAPESELDHSMQWTTVAPEGFEGEFTVELDGLDGRIGQLHDHLLQLAPEGEWRQHLQHLENFDPEMLQKLHEKFGEGQEFMELHVQPFLHRQHQVLEHAAPHAEKIREKVIEALRNAELNLDDETKARLHEAVTKALESAMTTLHEVKLRQAEGDAPVLFELMEKSEGDHIMVLPEGGRLRLMPHTEVAPHPEQGGDASDRLRRLEERLGKLEALLQQLLEKQGGGNQWP